MKTKNSKNSNLDGNIDSSIVYTGQIVDMGGFDLGELGVESFEQMNPNVSEVLEDLISMSYGKIGDIVIREDLTSPEGIQQKDLMKVGITGDNKAPYATKIIFFGVILDIAKGETLVSIKQKMLDVFSNYVEANMYFVGAEYNDVNDIVFTYKDTRKHNSMDMIPYPEFLSLEFDTITENNFGVGKWELLGTKNESIGGASIPLNYYKRVG